MGMILSGVPGDYSGMMFQIFAVQQIKRVFHSCLAPRDAILRLGGAGAGCDHFLSFDWELKLSQSVAVVPPDARLVEECLDADLVEPSSHVATNELGGRCQNECLRWRVCNEQVGEALEHVVFDTAPDGAFDRDVATGAFQSQRDS